MAKTFLGPQNIALSFISALKFKFQNVLHFVLTSNYRIYVI